MALTSVLQTSCNTLHGQNKGVFQSRRILASRVKLDQFISRFARIHFHDLLGETWAHLHAVARVSDALQGIYLAHVEDRDVWITERKPLSQVRVSLKELLVPSNLRHTKSYK